MHSFDVIIAGGGMVGLTIACGLQGNGLRIAVVERGAAPQALDPVVDEAKVRVSAINAASEKLLKDLNVWHDITQQRLSPYHRMKVWQRDSSGEITFDADDYGYRHLGHIIENDVIQGALWHKAASYSDITLFANTGFKQVVWGENEVFATLDNDEILTGRLMVAADGAHSWIRSQANIPLTFKDYGHWALVATIKTEKPHQHCARQAFHQGGILAFLPLWQDDLCSIVWSLPPDEAQAFALLDKQQFERQLAITFDHELGQCQLVSERLTLPLTARYARSFAAQRLVLAGDAAHTIHPLAGLGANLGLMDALELIQQIKRLQSEGKDIGHYLYLRRYERKRKHSAAVMLAAMQGLKSLFDGSSSGKKRLADLGLKLVDHLPLIKTQFVRQAMGMNENTLK